MHTAMDKNTKYDTGESGCGSPYYATTMEPKDWWKWFKGIYSTIVHVWSADYLEARVSVILIAVQ